MAEEKEQVKVRIPEANLNQKPAVWVTGGEKLIPGGIPSPKSKVAIVGFAPSSMTDVRPYFADPAFEIWGINQLYIAFPAVVQAATRWFQIHTRREYDTALRDHNHHDWLAGKGKLPHNNNFPIYMQEPIPTDIPMAIPFPHEELTKYFGRYFTNSISWEIALAIYETVQARKKGLSGFTDIFIFGVDMAKMSGHVKPSLIDLEDSAELTGRKQAEAMQRERLSEMGAYSVCDSLNSGITLN